MADFQQKRQNQYSLSSVYGGLLQRGGWKQVMAALRRDMVHGNRAMLGEVGDCVLLSINERRKKSFGNFQIRRRYRVVRA